MSLSKVPYAAESLHKRRLDASDLYKQFVIADVVVHLYLLVAIRVVLPPVIRIAVKIPERSYAITPMAQFLHGLANS